jgi:hypothetical protein
MKLSTRSLLPLYVALFILHVVDNERHQVQAFTSLSSLLRPSTATNSARVGHSPRNNNKDINNNKSPRRYRTFLSVSRTSVERTQAEKLKTPVSETPSTSNAISSVIPNDNNDTDRMDTEDAAHLAQQEFQKGFLTIAFITLLNASLAPIWHVAFQGAHTPPPLFLNAVVSLTAAAALLVGGPFLDASVDSVSSALAPPSSSSSSTISSSSAEGDNESNSNQWSAQSWRGGMELGLWKGLGT